MKRHFLPAYDRAFSKLTSEDQDRVYRAIEKLLQSLTQEQLMGGLGLKRLRGKLWEARAGLAIRILFMLEKDNIIFSFVGDHDDVRRYLKKS